MEDIWSYVNLIFVLWGPKEWGKVERVGSSLVDVGLRLFGFGVRWNIDLYLEMKTFYMVYLENFKHFITC